VSHLQRHVINCPLSWTSFLPTVSRDFKPLIGQNAQAGWAVFTYNVQYQYTFHASCSRVRQHTTLPYTRLGWFWLAGSSSQGFEGHVLLACVQLNALSFALLSATKHLRP
jgi:hypothetical protein